MKRRITNKVATFIKYYSDRTGMDVMGLHSYLDGTCSWEKFCKDNITYLQISTQDITDGLERLI